MTTSIPDCIKALVREFDDFKTRTAPYYTDSKSALDEKKIRKLTKDDRLVPDVMDLWTFCGKMRNLLNKHVNALDKAKTTVDEKDKLLNEGIKSLPGVIEKMIEEKITEALGSSGQKKSNTSHADNLKHTLLIESTDETKFTRKTWSEVAQSAVKPKLEDIPVSSSAVNRSGVGILNFPTAESRDRAANVLGSDYKVSKKSEPAKKLAPKIKIVGMSNDLLQASDDDVINHIRNKNAQIAELINDGEDFSIIHKNKEEGFIVIKTTSKVRHVIKDMNDKVYIGLHRLNVYDNIHLVQCFRCQEYGHYANSDICKDKQPACFYCSKSHMSTDCPVKRRPSEHRCINCTHLKHADSSHKATDYVCPVRIRETLRLYNRTDCDTDQAKNSYLKMIEDLKNKRRKN